MISRPSFPLLFLHFIYNLISIIYRIIPATTFWYAFGVYSPTFLFTLIFFLMFFLTFFSFFPLFYFLLPFLFPLFSFLFLSESGTCGRRKFIFGALDGCVAPYFAECLTFAKFTILFRRPDSAYQVVAGDFRLAQFLTFPIAKARNLTVNFDNSRAK